MARLSLLTIITIVAAATQQAKQEEAPAVVEDLGRLANTDVTGAIVLNHYDQQLGNKLLTEILGGVNKIITRWEDVIRNDTYSSTSINSLRIPDIIRKKLARLRSFTIRKLSLATHASSTTRAKRNAPLSIVGDIMGLVFGVATISQLDNIENTLKGVTTSLQVSARNFKRVEQSLNSMSRALASEQKATEKLSLSLDRTNFDLVSYAKIDLFDEEWRMLVEEKVDVI